MTDASTEPTRRIRSIPIAEYHCPDDLGAEVYAMLARSLDESRAARARRKLAAMEAEKPLPRKGNRAPRKAAGGFDAT